MENHKEITASERRIIGELTKDLESITEQVQRSLIESIQIRAEMKHLISTVQDLRSGEGTGSIVTRIALLEQSIAELKEYANRDTQHGTNVLQRLAVLEQKTQEVHKVASTVAGKKQLIDMNEDTGKWKLYGIIATGAFTFLTSVVSLLMQFFGG